MSNHQPSLTEIYSRILCLEDSLRYMSPDVTRLGTEIERWNSHLTMRTNRKTPRFPVPPRVLDGTKQTVTGQGAIPEESPAMGIPWKVRRFSGLEIMAWNPCPDLHQS